MMYIVIIPREKARELWPFIEDYCNDLAALTNGCFLAEDFLAEIERGELVLWAAYDIDRSEIVGIAMTELANYPRRKCCRVTNIAGKDMRDWIYPMRDAIEEYAKRNGATIIEANVRKGWLKVFTEVRQRNVLVYKELAR